MVIARHVDTYHGHVSAFEGLMSLEDIEKRWEERFDLDKRAITSRYSGLVRSEIRKLLAYAKACNAYFDSEWDVAKNMAFEQVKAAREALEKE